MVELKRTPNHPFVNTGFAQRPHSFSLKQFTLKWIKFIIKKKPFWMIYRIWWSRNWNINHHYYQKLAGKLTMQKKTKFHWIQNHLKVTSNFQLNSNLVTHWLKKMPLCFLQLFLFESSLLKSVLHREALLHLLGRHDIWFLSICEKGKTEK